MNLSKIRILLVDDDEDDFVNIRSLLSDNSTIPYEINWKPSYDEGLEALRQHHYDACLLDYRLGARSGLDLLKEVIGENLNCPVILLTGHGDYELDLLAMRTGAAEYLVKSQLTAPLLDRSIRYSIKHHIDLREISVREVNFKTLLNSTFEGIIVHRNGEITDVNATAGEIFGVSSRNLTGQNLFDFIRADHRNRIESALSSGSRARLEGVGVRRDGTEVFIELSSRMVTLNGQNQSLVAIRDLTERKQMESQILQQDRLASLGLLSSSLAHEIGTPLGVIRGRAEMAANKSQDNKEVYQNLEVIITQIDRIAQLVNSLLHLARGKKQDGLSAVNIRSALQDVLNLVQHEVTRKGISLEVKVDDNLKVKAEPGPLGQVLLNLLVNAVHAIEETKKGGRKDAHKILVETRVARDAIEISVNDSGCGISEKNLSQLFKPFFTTKEIGHGTGLGLATSFNIVNSWGGTISVKSRPDQGSNFTISLPKANPTH